MNQPAIRVLLVDDESAIRRALRPPLIELGFQVSDAVRGEEALHAMGAAYIDELLTGDRVRLRAQMQAYSACDDPEICAVVRNGFGDLVAYAQRVSSLPPENIAHFFATGMLLNVLASMQVTTDPEPWAKTLLEGCGKDI